MILRNYLNKLISELFKQIHFNGTQKMGKRFDYATYCTKRGQTRLTFLRFSIACLLGLRYINLCIVILCFVYSRSP